MNQRINDELNMFKDVQSLFRLPANAAKIAGIPDLVDGVKELDDHIRVIDGNIAIANADTKGVRGNKDYLINLVITDILTLSGPLVNLGRKRKDNDLITKFNFKKYILQEQANNLLLSTASNTIEAANTNILDLASAGVTPAMVTTLQDDSASLSLILTSPTAAKQAKKVANQDINDELPLTRELFELTLKPLMFTNFFATDLKFYELFITATQIISTGRHHLDFFGLLVDKQTGNHLHGALIQVMNGDKLIAKAKSGKKGHFRFKVIPEGTYTVVISLPGYLTQTDPDIVIIKGESTKKTFFLNPTPGKPVIN